MVEKRRWRLNWNPENGVLCHLRNVLTQSPKSEENGCGSLNIRREPVINVIGDRLLATNMSLHTRAAKCLSTPLQRLPAWRNFNHWSFNPGFHLYPIAANAPASFSARVHSGTAKGAIEVNVPDSVTGQPVAGADVPLMFFQTPPPNVIDSNEHQTTIAALCFPTLLPSGSYSVRQRATATLARDRQPLLRRRCDQSAIRLPQTVDLQLARRRNVTGILRSPGHAASAGSSQSLTKDISGWAGCRCRIENAETDDRGRYRFH